MPEDAAQAEVWMQPWPGVSLARLKELICIREIIATPRLGERLAHHPKGYRPGNPTWLRLLDEQKQEKLAAEIFVTDLLVKPLDAIESGDLLGCGPMLRTREDVERALAYFEGRGLRADEPVTVVRFFYRGLPCGPKAG